MILLALWLCCYYCFSWLCRALAKVSGASFGDISLGRLLAYSQKLSMFNQYLEGLILTVAFFLVVILIVTFFVDLISGQLKRDYYSIQIGKHLQRDISSNNTQLVTSEQKKANYWLRRLRIIRWRHRLVVLVPCGPNAAVQGVIKERCDNYLVNWLHLNFSKVSWGNRIKTHDSLHFNWLVVEEKKKWK